MLEDTESAYHQDYPFKANTYLDKLHQMFAHAALYFNSFHESSKFGKLYKFLDSSDTRQSRYFWNITIFKYDVKR